MFDQMKAVEEAAVIVQANVDGETISNCKMLADTIMDHKLSAKRNKILEHAQKAFKFLYTSRRGFYCSLCNQKYHPYIDIYSSSIISSNQFCQSMVENTFNFYLFKYDFFVKYSRLYAMFMTTCDFKGRYTKTKFVPYQSKFFHDPKVIDGIHKCQKNIGDPHGFRYCQDYCSNFNPARYSEALEGDIDRIKGFAVYLENLMETKQIQYERESAKDVLNMKGRLLEALINRKIEMDTIKNRQLSAEGDAKKPDEPKKDEEPKKDGEANKPGDDQAAVQAVLEPMNTINRFNVNYRAAILNPIMYNFSDDMSIEHSTIVHKSIFNQGFYKTYRMHKYKNYFDSEGINWYGMGKNAQIDRFGAKAVLEMVPHNDIEYREIMLEVMKD
jgi:hypothetical protein